MRKDVKLLGEVLRWGLVVLGLVVCIFPIYYLALTALKPSTLLFSVPPVFFFRPSLGGILDILFRQGYYRFFVTSFFVALAASVGAVGLASAAAFAYNRLRFRGKEEIFFLTLIPRMFPPVTTLIPIFLLIQKLNLLDTAAGLIIPYVGFEIPMSMLIMRRFFAQLPAELFESASIDGSSTLGMLVWLAAPLAAPGILACLILSFTFCWNELLFGLVLTSSRARTAAVALATFVEAEGQVQWGAVASLGLVTILPAVLFVLFMQRYLVDGLTLGAMKE